MAKSKKSHSGSKRGGPPEAVDLRVIGGKFRGSKLRYHGDPLTRPMKHRVREAVFNLVGTECKGRYAVDLFAGTGAVGIEAISRGAIGATFIERHIPTARIIQENLNALVVSDECQVLTTSTFLWAKRDLPHITTPPNNASPSNPPWLVFCSPPYSFYHERQREMLDLVDSILQYAPAESILVVEADEPFDFQLLPGEVASTKRDSGWDVRSYPPAVIGVWRM